MKARVEVDFKSAAEARSCLKALEQETEFRKRGGSRVSASDKKLLIEIRADDVVALRATLNSYLRLIQVIKGMSETE